MTKYEIAITLCYFPVTSGFSVLLNQSINQSKYDKVWHSYHTLLFSGDFWIFCSIESINQSKYDKVWHGYHTLLFSSDFWIFCAIESINQSINAIFYLINKRKLEVKTRQSSSDVGFRWVQLLEAREGHGSHLGAPVHHQGLLFW